MESILSFDDPIVLAGLLLGALLPFVFSAVTMERSWKSCFEVVNEVRRQLREIPGIMQETAKPEYGRAVDIVTKAAIREMATPGILAIFVPLLVEFFLGPKALAGLLIGLIAVGFMLALMMDNGGGAWDNAKKLIEEGRHGGKGSKAYRASIVGSRKK